MDWLYNLFSSSNPAPSDLAELDKYQSNPLNISPHADKPHPTDNLSLDAQETLAAENIMGPFRAAAAYSDTAEQRSGEDANPSVQSPTLISTQLADLARCRTDASKIDSKNEREACIKKIDSMSAELNKNYEEIVSRKEKYYAALNKYSQELMTSFSSFIPFSIGLGAIKGARMWKERQNIRKEIGQINAVIAQGLQPDNDGIFATHNKLVNSNKFLFTTAYDMMKWSKREFDAYMSCFEKHAHKKKIVQRSLTSWVTAATALTTNVWKGAMSYLPGGNSSSSSGSGNNSLASALEGLNSARI